MTFVPVPETRGDQLRGLAAAVRGALLSGRRFPSGHRWSARALAAWLMVWPMAVSLQPGWAWYTAPVRIVTGEGLGWGSLLWFYCGLLLLFAIFLRVWIWHKVPWDEIDWVTATRRGFSGGGFGGDSGFGGFGGGSSGGGGGSGSW